MKDTSFIILSILLIALTSCAQTPRKDVVVIGYYNGPKDHIITKGLGRIERSAGSENASGNLNGPDTLNLEVAGDFALYNAVKDKHGLWSVFVDGQLTEERTYKEDVLEGPFVIYDEMGFLRQKGTHKDGTLSTIDTTYYYHPSAQKSNALMCKSVYLNDTVARNLWGHHKDAITDLWDIQGNQLVADRKHSWFEYYQSIKTKHGIRTDTVAFDSVGVNVGINWDNRYSSQEGFFELRSILRTEKSNRQQTEIVEFDSETGYPKSYDYYYLDAEGRNRFFYLKSNESDSDKPLILDVLFYKCDSVRIEYFDINGTLINEVEASGYAWRSGTHVPYDFPSFLKCD